MTGTLNLDSIKKQVEQILVNSQDYPFDLNCDNLIQQWYNAKKPFIEKFGGTIWKYPEKVAIYLTSTELKKEFDAFLRELAELNTPLANDKQFLDFLEKNYEGFFSNVVVNSCGLEDAGIKKGDKLLKSFKKFTNNVREAQDLASRYIQRIKIEGYLYFSVDPVDFLTISENNENWASCHALDGDYRAGNLSYMADNTTLIAYLCDGTNKRLKALPKDDTWNSKKWRMLIHTNLDTVIYYNRQYPYNNKQLFEKTHEIFSSEFFSGFMSDPICRGFREVKAADGRNIFSFNSNQITFGSTTYDSRDLIDDSDYGGYCDLISSVYYAPTFSYRIGGKFGLYGFVHPTGFINRAQSREGFKEEKKAVIKNLKIKIGGRATCPCCGKGAIERTESFLCEKCIEEHDAEEDFFVSCCSCGHKIYPDDKHKIYKDEIYCHKCYTRLSKYWGN